MAQLSPEKRYEMLREVWAERLTIADICKKFDITPRTLYRWKNRYHDRVGTWNFTERVRNLRRPPKLRKKDAAAILEHALSRPTVGPKRIAAAVVSHNNSKKHVGATTVFKLLRQCKLNTYRLRLKSHHIWNALDYEGRKQMITEILRKNLDKFSF